jgi:NAD(P)-dependent dehydrogenase (short-subunit alcohol dehydrogenase family)
VVTGASSGIGFELAKVFGEEGFDLIIAAEDEELEGACGELNPDRPQRALDRPPLQARPRRHGRARRGPDPLHLIGRLDDAGRSATS